MFRSSLSANADSKDRIVENRVGNFLNQYWPDANLIWVSDGSRVYEINCAGRRAVLKVFLPMEISRGRLEPQRDTVERYERELAAANSFSTSKYGLEVIDANVMSQVPYIIFPFVTGSTLEHELDGGRVDRLRAVKILRCMIEAIRDLHNCGYVHCDIKPSNIMIEGERIFLIDFGCVKSIDILGNKDEPVYFSVGYTAPECLSRDQVESTGIDVFSLGMVAHELLGDGNPFNSWYEAYLGDETDSFDLYVKFLTRSDMPQLTGHRGVPVELATTIDMCTLFDPMSRLRDTSVLLETLGRIERHLILTRTGRLEVATAA